MSKFFPFSRPRGTSTAEHRPRRAIPSLPRALSEPRGKPHIHVYSFSNYWRRRCMISCFFWKMRTRKRSRCVTVRRVFLWRTKKKCAQRKCSSGRPEGCPEEMAAKRCYLLCNRARTKDGCRKRRRALASWTYVGMLILRNRNRKGTSYQ